MKAAVVTGASSGIGRQIALDLSRKATVYAIARRRSLLESLQSEAAHSHGHIVPLVGDLAESDDQQRLSDLLVSVDPPIDVVINNAGGSVRITEEQPERDWQQALEVQFHAVRRLTDALTPAMVDQGWGRVVNIGAPLEPPTRMNGSTVAKGALTMWSKIRSTELAPHGVTVNTVAPGRVLTEQVFERLHPTEADRAQFARENIPAGYLGEPSDVSALVGFLVSPAARYITGELIHVDGGLRRSAW